MSKDLEAGGVDVLHELMGKGLDLNAVLREYSRVSVFNGASRPLGTPLHFASYFGNLGAMKLLMNSGANVEAEDPTGCKALHWASAAANADGVRLLVGAGANIEAKGYRGETPLHRASMKGEQSMVRFLRRQERASTPQTSERKRHSTARPRGTKQTP